MTSFDDLPEPTSAAISRSHALIATIHQTLSFADYMALALYHPILGYYNSPEFTIGRQGDFTTAPEISPLFARCFARQCQQILTLNKVSTILELGPGTGQFACDLLAELERLNALPEHYYLYEINEQLKSKQQEKLRTTLPHLSQRITWLDALPQQLNGIIIANEVLDALPVTCFQVDGTTISERCVAVENDSLVWRLREASPALQAFVSELTLPHSYQSEVNLALPAFIRSLCDSLQTGVILLADYGYGQREYYHPERRMGTLTCFYRHHKHADPLILPGLQDITAHVDFTRVIETASEQGCRLGGYTTQAGFLLATGLLEMGAAMEKTLSPKEEFELHQAVKLLTMPTDMGERVKVMALCKGIETPLAGFSLQDRRREL